jgi:hypothetical protein
MHGNERLCTPRRELASVGRRSLAFNHSPTGARPDGGCSSQTELVDQAGALGEKLFEVALGPQLEADGLIRLIVPLDPIDSIGPMRSDALRTRHLAVIPFRAPSERKKIDESRSALLM